MRYSAVVLGMLAAGATAGAAMAQEAADAVAPEGAAATVAAEFSDISPEVAAALQAKAAGTPVQADNWMVAAANPHAVAAGAKAILDLPKTLEVLETLGVPVIAVGQDGFPAFWSRQSGLSAPLRLDTPQEIATAHTMRRRLGLPGGQLIANPIPVADEIAAATLAPIIATAQHNATRDGITGKAVTPYLLQRIYELTDGQSLRANIALARNNARLAARIAQALGRN